MGESPISGVPTTMKPGGMHHGGHFPLRGSRDPYGTKTPPPFDVPGFLMPPAPLGYAYRGAPPCIQGSFPSWGIGVPHASWGDGCLHLHPLEPCSGGDPHRTNPAWVHGDPGYPEGGSALGGMGIPDAWLGEVPLYPLRTRMHGVSLPTSAHGGAGCLAWATALVWASPSGCIDGGAGSLLGGIVVVRRGTPDTQSIPQPLHLPPAQVERIGGPLQRAMGPIQ